jgi:transcriptional regulator with PAS, ATPase and Fis domain
MDKQTLIQNIKMKYGVVGKSPTLNRALYIATQVAPLDLSVLIVGESGVGKEIIPKIIHDNSVRKHNKFFAINCGSIPEGTIDSELFGHEKGAFTGAIGEREGYFGAANKGTLFLDEVGELPLATQARLLRVLETGEYIRVGSNEVRKTDVRIVAATNVNMAKAISEGRFREDLYYRLNTIPISIPPLRERGEDVVLLFKKFAADISEKYGMPAIRLTEEAKHLLMRYAWPGNIRQLKNLTEQISVISSEREITKEVLSEYITDDMLGGSGIVHISKVNKQHDSASTSYENERDHLFRSILKLSNEVSEMKEFIKKHFNGQPPETQMVQHPGISIKMSDARYIPQSDGQFISSIPQASESTDSTDFIEVQEEVPVSMKELEMANIKSSLDRNHGKRRKTARELGISERTLYRKIKEYNLQ